MSAPRLRIVPNVTSAKLMLCCAVVLCLAIVFDGYAFSGWCGRQPPSDDLSKSVETRIQEILREEDTVAIPAKFRALFDKLSKSQIRALTTHPNDGVAIRAAWEEVIADLPAVADFKRPRARLPRERVQRFLGYT